jgi:hypothetical protein
VRCGRVACPPRLRPAEANETALAGYSVDRGPWTAAALVALSVDRGGPVSSPVGRLRDVTFLKKSMYTSQSTYSVGNR